MPLTNTIILPAGDAGLSKSRLTDLLKKNDILTVLIFGKDVSAENAVEKADVRANGTVSGIARKVAWMQDPGLLSFLKTLIADGPENTVDSIDTGIHIGIAISMDHKLMDVIPKNPDPDYIRMELAFINAGT